MKFDFFIFLTDASDVIKLHDIAIETFGGVPGLRDLGLLESALNHSLSMIYYGNDEDRKIHNLTASYFFHIIKNHPFVDGNKRAGLFAALHFLNINNFDIDVEYDVLYELALDTAASRINKEEIAHFFKENIKPHRTSVQPKKIINSMRS